MEESEIRKKKGETVEEKRQEDQKIKLGKTECDDVHSLQFQGKETQAAVPELQSLQMSLGLGCLRQSSPEPFPPIAEQSEYIVRNKTLRTVIGHTVSCALEFAFTNSR